MSDMVKWAERQFREVEQDGSHVTQIKLITPHDNEVWETWTTPWPSPAEWAESAESFLRSLEASWPNRGVPVVFVALSATGETLSKLPRKVEGKNKSGGGAPWNTEQAAFAMMMDNYALSMEKLQRLVNTQLDTARRTAESNAVTMFQQTEYIKLVHQNRAMDEAEKGAGPGDALAKMVTEHGSDFLELFKMMMSKSGGALNGKKPTNGAVHALKTTTTKE